MEHRRRTITTQNSQRKRGGRENGKKGLTILGIVLGLALVFFVSYKISYGWISTGENDNMPDSAISSSTEEDIANMSREDLEESYLKLKKQLEEKDEEIEMLKERLNEHEEPASTVAPETTTTPTEKPEKTESPSNKTPEPTAPPAATEKPTQPPVQETPPAATAGPDGGLMSPDDLANLTGATQ